MRGSRRGPPEAPDDARQRKHHARNGEREADEVVGPRQRPDVSAATVPASASTSGEYGPEIIGQPCHVSQGRADQHTDREDEGSGRDEGGKARIQRHLAESSQQDEQSIEPQQ